MSKRKKRKVIRDSQPTPAVEARPSRWRMSRFWSLKWLPALYVVGFSALFVVFLEIFARNPDFTNPLVTIKADLVTFQYIISILLVLCFGYFGWRYCIGAQEMQRSDRIIFLLTFVIIGTIYVAVFTKELSPNGDNAEYIIIAKSLVERGIALRLDTPSETPNTLASLGLPLMLAPIYKLWGVDIVKMKMMVSLLAVSIFFLLYRFYERRQGFALAILLSIVGVTSPYVVGNSTDVMTETPYLFWSLVSMLLILKYQESKYFQWKYYFLVIAAIVMTYLTRAIGIGALAAMLLFLTWNVEWSKVFNKADRRQMIGSTGFKKLFYIMTPLVVVATGWQIWQQGTGVSQATIFFNTNIAENLDLNCRSAFRVLGQILFNPETFRYQNFYSSSTLGVLDFKYTIVLILMLIGLLTGLRQRKLIAGYTLIVFIIIMLASATPAEMVIIRYLSVLIPFIIYFTFLGTNTIIQFLTRKLRLTVGTTLARIACALLLGQIVFVNMHGNSVNITKSAIGNGPAYQDYMDVASWSKINLPDTAYVVSVKPRIFYLLSEKKGTRLSTIQETYSDEFEREKLDLFKRLGITHIVLDGISGSTRENIFPIVKNNPEMFQTLYIGSTSGTSTISKIIYPNN